jgi:hypothetical protein
MTKKELVSLLKKYDDDMIVLIETQDGNEFEDFTVDEGFGAVVIKEF